MSTSSTAPVSPARARKALTLKAARQFFLRRRGVSQADVMRAASATLGAPVSESTVSRIIAGRKMDGPKTDAVVLAVIKLTGRKNFFSASADELTS